VTSGNDLLALFEAWRADIDREPLPPMVVVEALLILLTEPSTGAARPVTMG
jgi:hypothetical protein